LSRWLDVDPHSPRKAWSWTAVSSGRETALDIGLLDDTLAHRLLDGADTHRRRPSGTLRVREQPIPHATVTWAQLADGRDRAEWTVEFISPVTFRRGSRLLPWPEPTAVLGSLLADWRAFGADIIGDLPVELSVDPVVVTAVSGASRVEQVVLHEHDHSLGNVREPVRATIGGFLGFLRYAVEGPTDRRAIDSLFRLAPFAGVGAHTTHGFGGTRLPSATTN